MIETLNQYQNPEQQPQVTEAIQAYWNEARGLMPELPEDINIYFYNKIITPGYSSGGFAYAPDTITLGFDDTYPDETEKWFQLRDAVLHESYHLAQGFTGFDNEGKPRPVPAAIEQAVYEGAATVFEREYSTAQKKAGWAEYMDDATMLGLVKEVQALTDDYDIQQWKFYDPATDRKWTLYRTGTFIVDRALSKSKLDILDIRHKTWQEILDSAQL